MTAASASLKQLCADADRLVAALEQDPLPEGADDLLAEVAEVTEPIRVIIAIRDAAYARQTRCFRALRALRNDGGTAAVTNGRIATAAGITEEAVIRRLKLAEKADGAPAAPKPKRAPKKTTRKAASPRS